MDCGERLFPVIRVRSASSAFADGWRLTDMLFRWSMNEMPRAMWFQFLPKLRDGQGFSRERRTGEVQVPVPLLFCPSPSGNPCNLPSDDVTRIDGSMGDRGPMLGRPQFQLVSFRVALEAVATLLGQVH